MGAFYRVGAGVVFSEQLPERTEKLLNPEVS
jgi:hypothetical protein